MNKDKTISVHIKLFRLQNLQNVSKRSWIEVPIWPISNEGYSCFRYSIHDPAIF